MKTEIFQPMVTYSYFLNIKHEICLKTLVFFLTEQTRRLPPIIIFKNVFKISKCFDWNIWNRPRFRIETKYLQNIWKYIYEDLSNLYFVKREIGKNATLSINKRKTFKGKSAPWNLQQVDGAVKITFNFSKSAYALYLIYSN